MLVTTKIKIDLQRPSYPMVVNAVQGEQNTRQIELSLYSGCVAWMVPDNVAVAMRYSKPDKTKGYYDTMPDGSASFTVSENRILAFLAPQMLTVPGTVVAQIVLYQGTQTLATFSIHIRVEADPSAGAVTSEDYVNWAQWIKSELDAYLEKLKINGEFVGGTFVGDVNMNGHALSGLREPVAPDDAASKEYVDKNAGSGSVSTVAGVAPDADGNVPLTADDVKALPIGGGKMEGPINMNGHGISGLSNPTENDQVANAGYVKNQVTKARLRGLLVNPDFQNPINQRGQQSYTGIERTIDGWLISGNAGEQNTVWISEDGYIGFSSGNTTESVWLVQRPEPSIIPVGNKATFAVEQNGAGVYILNIDEWGTDKVVSFENGVSLLYQAGELIILNGTGAPIGLLWADLFAGEHDADTVSGHQRKDYGERLTECQRYLQRFRTETERKTYCEDFRPTMRMTPNGIVSKFEKEIDGVMYYFASAEL